MRLLVITPTLGTSPWLDQTVASVAAFGSAACHLQHVLVTPVDRVAALTRSYPFVSVMSENEDGGGLYEAINRAAERTPDWEWMTYLNDDDVLRPGFGQLMGIGATVPADILYGRVSYIDADGNDLGSFPVERRSCRFASLMAAGIPPFTQQGTLVSRECFEQLGGFDTCFRLAADFDFWVRAVVSGASFGHTPAEVGSFRLREGQLSASQDEVQAEQASITARHLPEQNQSIRFLVRSAFRLRHAPSILARRRLTGRWRTGGSVWRATE